jgi:hypothetical protein
MKKLKLIFEKWNDEIIEWIYLAVNGAGGGLL